MINSTVGTQLTRRLSLFSQIIIFSWRKSHFFMYMKRWTEIKIKPNCMKLLARLQYLSVCLSVVVFSWKTLSTLFTRENGSCLTQLWYFNAWWKLRSFYSHFAMQKIITFYDAIVLLVNIQWNERSLLQPIALLSPAYWINWLNCVEHLPVQ